MTTSSKKAPFHIAFDNLCRARWVAGCHYLSNLGAALKSLDSSPEITLFGQGDSQSQAVLTPYMDHQLHTPRLFQRVLSRVRRTAGIGWLADPVESTVESLLLRQRRIDVLLASRDHGPNFGLPLLIWIPDFQHRRLPDMFSKVEIVQRDRSYLRAVERASRVIVSSQDVLHDFQSFAPPFADKARVLHFVAQIPPGVYDVDPAAVCASYHLPERFIYLPNQFWKHKNHEVVVRALALAKDAYPLLTVVCTGNPQDYRNPQYFSELQQLIAALGVQDRIIILGAVEYRHIFGLIRQSVAVLQPSLFEGWSTTVEEAKSTGKRLILSNIPVHREQAPPEAVFFDPHNPQELAECLIATCRDTTSGPDKTLEASARSQLPLRTKEFGQRFVEIVKEIVPIE